MYLNHLETRSSFYIVDLATYLTSPSLAWDAMLLKLCIKLGLVHDIDMSNMMESMKRGVFWFVGSKRHVRANHKYMSEK